MRSFVRDLQFGFRMLLRKPGFTITALLALGLGIGLNTAIFSIFNTILLKPLPYANPENIVVLSEVNLKKGNDPLPVSPPDYSDWKAQAQSFDNIAAYMVGPSASFILTGGGDPERLTGAVVTPNIFSVLGTNPLLGRSFTPEESGPGSSPAVILSNGLWQRRFGSDPQIVGRTLPLNGKNYAVAGVMPKGFEFPIQTEAVELWVPFAINLNDPAQRDTHMLNVVARLKAGVPIERARSEMSQIAGNIERQYPESNKDIGATTISLQEHVVGNIRPALFILLGAVGFVLLIACANVANLLLARSAERQKEISIRVAMGASRARVARQLFTESTLLAALGGVLGLALAYVGLRVLLASLPSNIPRLREIGLDANVFVFTLLISIFTGFIFGLAPALQFPKTGLNEVLKEGGSRGSSAGVGSRRLRNMLVVSEVAMAVLLLIGAGLMMKSFLHLMRVNTGFDPQNVLTMRISLPRSKYNTAAQVRSFFQQTVERVRALPGVTAADISTDLPLGEQGNVLVFDIVGRPDPGPGAFFSANYRAIGPDYFKAMSIPLVKGRFFTEADASGAPGVILINETMARQYWPGEDPVGRQVKLDRGLREIVGVVKDVRQIRLDAAPEREMFEPFLQASWPSMTLVVRTRSDPRQMVPSVRGAVHSVDRDQPVSNVKTMEEVISESVAHPRLYVMLLGAFGTAALILSIVGIYGVLAYSVNQRRHEIGIRMALGASSPEVFKLIVTQGMWLTLIGTAIGLTAALFLTRILASLLFGVSTTDLSIFVGVPVVLALVSLVACYLPAHRASRVSPLEALRYE